MSKDRLSSMVKVNIQNIKSILVWFTLCANISAQATGNDLNKADILAIVNNRIIAVEDFIRRAEYTIRPRYCRGNGGVEKKIILNSLIAEKLLSIDTLTESELSSNREFQNFIKGRKEQAMRQTLSFYEGANKVVLKKEEVSKIYSLAGRKYNINYFTVQSDTTAGRLKKLFDKNAPFNKAFAALLPKDTLPVKQIEWSSTENPLIHNSLFSDSLNVGQILGPIKTSDSSFTFIRIIGWTDRIALTDKSVKERMNDVQEKLIHDKSIYLLDKYVAGVMRNKTVEFNKHVFNELTKIAQPIYSISTKPKKNLFQDLALKNKLTQNEEVMLESLGERIESISNKDLLKIDGMVWTINDLENEIKTHPLVFRNRKIVSKDFQQQFKLAIVDLIRDKYLTGISYERGYDTIPAVKLYTELWNDASVALYKKNQILKEAKIKKNLSETELLSYLNEYVNSLFKKYSGKIEINVERFNKISLSRIDLFALQPNEAYPIYVPAFPELTYKNNLNYGKKLLVEKN